MVPSLKTRPDWAGTNEDEVYLDMRRYLRHGLEPLPRIEEVLAELRPCQVFHLATEREPVLLYPLFLRLGFDRYTESTGEGWHTFLRKCRG